jgi:hypothetical protein
MMAEGDKSTQILQNIQYNIQTFVHLFIHSQNIKGDVILR